MAKDWNGVKIKCPFLEGAAHTDKGGVIDCEGITEDIGICLKCRTKSAYDIQLNAFCYGRYKNCEIYRMKCGIYGYED